MDFRNLHCEYWSEQEPWWHSEGVTRIQILDGQKWKARLTFEYYSVIADFVYAGCHMDMGSDRWNTTEQYGLLYATSAWTTVIWELPEATYSKFDLGDGRTIDCEKYIFDKNKNKAIGDWDRDVYLNRVVGSPTFTDLTAEYGSDQEPSWHAPGSAVPIAQGDGWSARIKFNFNGIACTVNVAAAMKMPDDNWNTAPITVSLPDTLDPVETICVVVGTYERFGLEACRRIDVDKYIAWPTTGLTILRDTDVECYHNTVGSSEFRNLTAEYGSQLEQWWHSPGSFVPVSPGDYFDGRITFDHRGIEETVTVAIAMKMPDGNWNTASAQITVSQSADWITYVQDVRGYYQDFGLEPGKAIDVDKYIAKLDGTTILRDGDTDCFFSEEEEGEPEPDPTTEMMTAMMPMMLIAMMASMVPKLPEAME